jgi:hypothetical protein
MRLAAFALVLALAGFVGGAGATKLDADRDPPVLIRLWTHEYENCRGSYPNDPRRDAACAAMETYHAKLRAIGWCYGKSGQIRAEMTWHKCGPDSLRD